jgi:hypothetical protein
VRRSERTKAGIARTQSQGKVRMAVGRRPGSKDGQKRRRSGYVARWERPGERERARERALGLNKGQSESDDILNSIDPTPTTG